MLCLTSVFPPQLAENESESSCAVWNAGNSLAKHVNGCVIINHHVFNVSVERGFDTAFEQIFYSFFFWLINYS